MLLLHNFILIEKKSILINVNILLSNYNINNYLNLPTLFICNDKIWNAKLDPENLWGLCFLLLVVLEEMTHIVSVHDLWKRTLNYN